MPNLLCCPPDLNMSAWKFAILSSLILGVCSLPAQIAQSQTSSTSSTQQTSRKRPPAPPETPLPPNQTTPGGGLNPQNSSCIGLDNPLRALVPIENPVFTTEAHPTFLFFSSLTANQVDYGEFSVLSWPGEEQQHYTTRFDLPASPGIVSITLPTLPEYALEKDKTYRWYFQLYCEENQGQPLDLTVSGAIERVELTVERSQKIQAASPDVWYDALAQVAEQLQQMPQDADLNNTWQELLQAIEAQDLATEQFVGPVLLLEN